MHSNYHCQSLILSFLYRYLSRLKSYVRNRAASERSIAEGYIVMECLTFCELEKIFPPSFFIVMVHLVMHLTAEAKISGLVHYRWMYLIER